MSSFAVGDKVRLKACLFGDPGTVLRKERTRLVVYWAELDYIGRHPDMALVIAKDIVSPRQHALQGEMNYGQ
jgi:hypothetical protein